MKDRVEIKELWECPKCGRKFERRGQSHSCSPYKLDKHFAGKPEEKILYQKLKKAVKQRTGPFKIESLSCCIHFVSTFTFTAVKIMKNKIRVDFSLGRKLKSKRIADVVQMSAHRYLYVVDIGSEDEIDDELMEWIQEARDKKKEMLKAG